ncbi:MAG TPA: hypothetical protein VN368_01295, partial [Candidatus Methylomirabilis sp.]|nr:hypothetical protein [Candidatus Methylomirabilis sp.]
MIEPSRIFPKKLHPHIIGNCLSNPDLKETRHKYSIVATFISLATRSTIFKQWSYKKDGKVASSYHRNLALQFETEEWFMIRELLPPHIIGTHSPKQAYDIGFLIDSHIIDNLGYRLLEQESQHRTPSSEQGIH